jgi:glutamyl-tRNA synthetase
VGNLRTALVAWLFARSSGGRFKLRVEDLDAVASRAEVEAGQLADLAALGLEWDGPVVRQSQRWAEHRAALDRLTAGGHTYPCFCTRREIREASQAAHGPTPGGSYPGTCRSLTPAEQTRRARGRDRPPALRLRWDGGPMRFEDRLHGSCRGPVEDVVLCRNDGTPAYNLAVVVDDAAAGVTEVARGDDLIPSTPAQVALAGLLGLPVPVYAHVPLALGPGGRRLAKRDGAVTLADLAARGVGPAAVLGHLAASLGLASPGEPVTAADLVTRFDPDRLPREPWYPGPPFVGSQPAAAVAPPAPGTAARGARAD